MKNNQPQKNTSNGWQETKLSDIGVFSKGVGISKEQLSESGYNAIRYGELYTKHNFQVKKIYSFIKDDVASQAKEIKYGDILFAGSGETIDEIGKSAAYLLEEKAYAGGDTIIFTPKNANSLFLSYFLNIGEGRKKLSEMGQGQSVVHIYKSEIEKLKLHLPPIDEQNRIVSVLETWDKLLEILTQKVEAKKQIKKGLMQDLLTGKKRLKGFSRKWNLFEFGEVCKFWNGFPFSSKDFSSVSGVRIIRNRDLKGDSSILYFSGENAPDAYFVNNGDVLIGMDGDFIACRWTKGIALLNQRVGRLTAFKNSDKDYLFYRIQIPLKIIEQETSSTTVKHLSSYIFEKYKIILPEREEQEAIANILTTADREITTLQKKLSLLKEQKRYLLNNLITGTIRTPETLSTKPIK